tara:strand:- start:118 stop:1356 length:1239 start_codon:yes stop_codon:yes gene_type:complete
MAKLDCFKCQGKKYTQPLSCGHRFCPVVTKVNTFQTNKLEKKEFLGTAPAVFVGRYNYPNLNVGILAPPDRIRKDAELFDAPKTWGQKNFSIQDVLKFRGALINSKFQTHIKSKPRFLEMSQEVAMAAKPIDIEFKLERKPVYQMKHLEIATPMGARASLRKADFQGNVKVNHKVDYIVSDNDLKSVDSLAALYKKGYDENFLTRLLSVGTLGLKTQRKLVPTRWSITAVDDTLGKQAIKEIKKYKESDYLLHFGGYMGNYFLIMFFPRVWSYELFEMYMPSTLMNPDREVKCTTDFEFYAGRKKYAEECAGGYYANRLPILEKLKEMKRQASVIVLRFTTDEYSVHLGVWVCREATRHALQTKRYFESEEEMLDYAKRFILTRFNFNIDSMMRKSKVYEQMKRQKSIKEYF